MKARFPPRLQLLPFEKNKKDIKETEERRKRTSQHSLVLLFLFAEVQI